MTSQKGPKMAREIVNSSMKDSSIVALLPASVTTREGAGVFWYDVRADPKAVSCRLDAVDKDGNILESIDAQSVAPSEFKATAQASGGPSLGMTLTASRADGTPQVRARFEDGREVVLTESAVEPHDAGGMHVVLCAPRRDGRRDLCSRIGGEPCCWGRGGLRHRDVHRELRRGVRLKATHQES